MEINIAKSAGFCFGVRRALDIAHKAAHDHKRVYMRGDIVHNEQVVRSIRKLGIRKIESLSGVKGKGETLLIRAHGCSLRFLKKAQRKGYAIIDATCPMVKEIHRIAKNMELQGYSLIIIGDKKHDEVRGIVGQLSGNALVIDHPDNINLKYISGIKKAAVVVQSTQNQERVDAIVSILNSLIGEVKFFNTICQPTRTKQQEIKTMPLENDAVIVIGSKASANTKRLYEISRALNKQTYWVQDKDDILPQWLKGVKKVGVTSGASTPDETTREVIERIKMLGRNLSHQRQCGNRR